MTNGSGVNSAHGRRISRDGQHWSRPKRFDQVVRAADRHEWPADAPGKTELFESARADHRLWHDRAADRRADGGVGASVTAVTRTGEDGTLTPDQWRARLGEFDWVMLAAPATPESRHMIGAAELRAMKPSALAGSTSGAAIRSIRTRWSRRMHKRRIGGAFLDRSPPSRCRPITSCGPPPTRS
ncbi:MAG: NAD(P)-dependent oxidoreductase [Sphingomonas sp.]